jgi:hypothetical protein
MVVAPSLTDRTEGRRWAVLGVLGPTRVAAPVGEHGLASRWTCRRGRAGGREHAQGAQALEAETASGGAGSCGWPRSVPRGAPRDAGLAVGALPAGWCKVDGR